MQTARVLFIMTLLTFLIGCQQQAQQPEKDGAFIHISSGYENPHKVLMALRMAEILSETKDVLVYFDIRGVEIVLRDSSDLVFNPFPSSHTQLKKLLQKNIPVMTCPGCLKTAGKTEKDLMDGIQIADKNAFFQFTKGRILTLDY